MNERKVPVMSLVCAVCLLWFCLSVRGTSKGGPKLGDKPPLLRATTLLQGPPGGKLLTRNWFFAAAPVLTLRG